MYREQEQHFKILYVAILETAMPAWIADSHSINTVSPYEKFYTGSVDNIIYAIWIGVSDIGGITILLVAKSLQRLSQLILIESLWLSTPSSCIHYMLPSKHRRFFQVLLIS